MKSNYSLKYGRRCTDLMFKASMLFLAGIALPANAQQTYSFTAAGATGGSGPTQTQLNGAYASTNLNGQVTSLAGIQSWTVSASGVYSIRVSGAAGGTSTLSPFHVGGLGSQMQGDFNLNAGDVISVLVGQKGLGCKASTGGGGTYVVRNNVLLIAAGGGGGGTSNFDGANSTTLTSGTNDNSGGVTLGGTNGGGGQTCNANMYDEGGGGGGYSGNGSTANGSTPGGGGFSFLNGGGGGSGALVGGFGGGGGIAGTYYCGGAGGGGYSGGAGGQQGNHCNTNINYTAGGGGGSYNTGANQVNTGGVNAGDGFAIFTSLCDVNLTASGNNSLSPVICQGQSVTLTTNAISNYSWSTGSTSHSITVSPTVTTSYTVSGASALSCTSSAVITVTVSTAAPTLSVTSSTNSICFGNTVNIHATGSSLNYTITNGSQVAPNNTGFFPSMGVNNYTVTGDNGCGTPTTVVTITVSSIPVTITSSSTLVCAGSPATLTAGGGAANYTWTPGPNTTTNYVVYPASSTIYTLTGRTSSCSGAATVSITTKANPSITIVPSSSVICNGDVVNLVANGNSTAYVWSNGQSGPSISPTPTALTLYSATGTGSNGCVSTAQQVVRVNPVPVLSAFASNPVVCSNGSTTLTAFGATTYTWDNNGTSVPNPSVVVNPVSDATYSVTGSYTTGCHSTTIVSVAVFIPTLGVSANTTVCYGGHFAISANGADTYTWVNNNSGGSGLSGTITANTIYTVTGMVTDPVSGVICPGTNTVEVDVNPNPTITAVSNRTNNAMCVGESAMLTGSGAGSTGTYAWIGGSGTATTPTLNVSPLSDQSYTVTGTDDNGCKGSAHIQMLVTQCTGIAQLLQANQLSIYPNPNNGEFTVSSDKDITLQITNELGQQVRIINLNNKATTAKISNLPNGVYFITGENSSGRVKQKIVVMK